MVSPVARQNTICVLPGLCGAAEGGIGSSPDTNFHPCVHQEDVATQDTGYEFINAALPLHGSDPTHFSFPVFTFSVYILPLQRVLKQHY